MNTHETLQAQMWTRDIFGVTIESSQRWSNFENVEGFYGLLSRLRFTGFEKKLCDILALILLSLPFSTTTMLCNVYFKEYYGLNIY